MVRGHRSRNGAGGRGVATTPAVNRTEGKRAETDTPQRRCIVTGTIADRAGLLRVVVGPDGAIVPDIEARLPGRGLWLTPQRDIVERAVAKRMFARAAGRPVTAPDELADRIESLLAQRCCDGVGLARRAGIAVAGFDRVGEMLRRGRVGLLLAAIDGADAGRDKLAALGSPRPTASVLTAAELGAAFGRERIVHAAVGEGPLCRRLLLDLSRLAGFRQGAAVDLGREFAPVTPAAEDGGSRTHG